MNETAVAPALRRLCGYTFEELTTDDEHYSLEAEQYNQTRCDTLRETLRVKTIARPRENKLIYTTDPCRGHHLGRDGQEPLRVK